jgi:hypothetical protein
LDAKAIKNKDFYEKLDKDVQEKVKTMDFKDLEKKYDEIIQTVGTCPISCCNLLEAMQGLDCMCICLYITRPAAAIVDPTRIIIKKIIPYFV